jgi:RNA polymerase sigma factor (sigma-70 family)
MMEPVADGRADSGAPRPESISVACGLAQENSIDAIYLDHVLLLRRVAIRKFNVPPADAESLVHDVFINYLTHTRHVRRDLRAYLVGAICNASRNYWRSRRSEDRVFATEYKVEADTAVVDDPFDGLASKFVIASVLAKLGTRCQEVLRRYYLDEEATPQIAAAIETTCGNVNYLMHVCRKRARDAYQAICRKR